MPPALPFLYAPALKSPATLDVKPMLQINAITLRIAGRVLLENASVALPGGAKVGLVGRNGTGKTTLFRAITGDIGVESGSISVPAGARIGRLEQEAPDGPHSLLETVLAADTELATLTAEADVARDPHRIAEIHTRLADIGAHDAPARAGRILHGLGFDTAAQARPCSEFSGGWRMRVALAGLLFSEPDLLLLDEPTNYLDLEGALWLERYVARYRHTVIIVSHDRDLLNKAVDTIVHLSDCKLKAWRGGYDQFERQRREQQALQGKMQVRQEAQRKHMEAFVARFRYKASKARQAQSRLKALARLEPIAAMASERVLPIRFCDPDKPATPPIIQAENVSVGYTPGKPVLAALDLRIDDDDRIGLLGTNGNGKSTFAKLLAGQLTPEDGTMVTANKLSIGYFAQHQIDLLVPEQSAVEHVRVRLSGRQRRSSAQSPAERNRSGEAQVRARVAQMGLSTEKMDTPAENLSGGEKARLVMGLAAFDAPHLLILDEPTNHLDVDSREALVHALNSYSGAVILISHDRHLLEACVDRLWLVAEGTIRPFGGDLDDYRQLVLKELGPGAADGTGQPENAVSHREARRQAAAQREKLGPVRKKIKECEALMADLEKKIQSIDDRLVETGLYQSDPEEAARLAQLRARRADKLAKAEDIWLELTALSDRLAQI